LKLRRIGSAKQNICASITIKWLVNPVRATSKDEKLTEAFLNMDCALNKKYSNYSDNLLIRL
jgi:hypothetical protein